MEKVSIAQLQIMKQAGGRITMLTAYDYPMASILDSTGVDMLLVGDSLGMVVLGYESTAPVTMEEMLHHAKAARRGTQRALLIGDMPLLALSGSRAEAVTNASRFVQEAGCDGVKVEWKRGIEDVAKAIVDAGIPVIGHVGLTPQTAAGEGGYGIRGKDAKSAGHIVGQTAALEAVGCFAVVLECVPDLLAQEITKRLTIPTLGIGSGPFCDGQVLVTPDLVGLFERFRPKFVKRYANVADSIRDAATAYIREVKSGAFPGKEHTFAMRPDEFAKLKDALGSS